MKKRIVLLGMVAVFGWCGFGKEGKDLAYYGGLMRGTSFYKTKTGAVFALSELDEYTGIELAGGGGSGGSAAMQLIVLRDGMGYLFEPDGAFIHPEPPKTDGEKIWIARLSVSSQNTQGLLELLSHTNAAVRFIGLVKVRRLSKFPPVVEDALRKIVESDPWVQYYGRSNDNPDDPFRDFHADLRDLASEMLAEKGIRVSVDRRDVAKKGVDYIAWYSKNHGKQLVVSLLEFDMDSRSEGYRVLSEYVGSDPAILELQKSMKAAFLRRGGKNIERLTSCVPLGKIPGGTNTQNEVLVK